MRKHELVNALEKALTEYDDTIYIDWWSKTSSIYSVTSDLNMEIAVDNGSFGDDGYFTCVTYWSNKLRKSIILTWDADTDCQNIRELAEHLVNYEYEAKALEKSITVIK